MRYRRLLFGSIIQMRQLCNWIETAETPILLAGNLPFSVNISGLPILLNKLLFLKLFLSLLKQFFRPILSRGLSNSLLFLSGFSAFFYPFQWLIQGRGPGGPAPPLPLFLEQTEGWRAEQLFFLDCGNCVTVYFTSLWHCCCCCSCCWCCS